MSDYASVVYCYTFFAGKHYDKCDKKLFGLKTISEHPLYDRNIWSIVFEHFNMYERNHNIKITEEYYGELTYFYNSLDNHLLW